jgi:excisionase family DNA binding protein
MGKLDQFLTTAEAGKELGVTRGRVQAMLRAGQMVGIRKGRVLLIARSELAKVRDRKPGRPWPRKKK